MTKYLDVEDLLIIARDAVGGEVVVRDHGLLASAAARPQATVFGEEAYPTLHLKATALLHSVDFVLAVASGELVDVEKIADVLAPWSPQPWAHR